MPFYPPKYGILAWVYARIIATVLVGFSNSSNGLTYAFERHLSVCPSQFFFFVIKPRVAPLTISFTLERQKVLNLYNVAFKYFIKVKHVMV